MSTASRSNIAFREACWATSFGVVRGGLANGANGAAKAVGLQRIGDDESKQAKLLLLGDDAFYENVKPGAA
jgi:hypothetical protein